MAEDSWITRRMPAYGLTPTLHKKADGSAQETVGFALRHQNDVYSSSPFTGRTAFQTSPKKAPATAKEIQPSPTV